MAGHGRECDCPYCSGQYSKVNKTSAVSALLSRPLATEEIIRRQRQYIEKIQPFIKVRADIVAIQPFTLFKNGVNGYDRKINWLPGSKESFDMAGHIIEQIGREILQAR